MAWLWDYCNKTFIGSCCRQLRNSLKWSSYCQLPCLLKVVLCDKISYWYYDMILYYWYYLVYDKTDAYYIVALNPTICLLLTLQFLSRGTIQTCTPPLQLSYRDGNFLCKFFFSVFISITALSKELTVKSMPSQHWPCHKGGREILSVVDSLCECVRVCVDGCANACAQQGFLILWWRIRPKPFLS